MNLQELVNRRVTLTHNLPEKNAEGHLAEELDGVIQAASPDGVAFILKPRGSTTTKLIEMANVEPDSIHLVVEKPRELKAKELASPALNYVRAHLIQAHGWTISAINKIDDEVAREEHNKIDHTDLGHFHTRSDEEAEG